MKTQILLALIALIYFTNGQDQCTDDECCTRVDKILSSCEAHNCQENGESCSCGDYGCQEVVETTTPSPVDPVVTPYPTTPAPDTPSPVSSVVTPQPTEDGICYCLRDGLDALTPAPTAASKKKKSKDGSGGMGYGDCDCDKDYKMAELRFVYEGTEDGATVVIGNPAICTFTDVEAGAEITCNVIAAGGEKFETNTEIDVSFPNSGSTGCTDTFHTSCSQDIVGELADNGCIFLRVSGWKDGNPTDNDCDDGYDQCACDGTVIDSTYVPEIVIDEVVGEKCYCEDPDVVDATPSPVAVSSGSKKKKSKSGSKDNGGGLGYGDCDCDKNYGMVELRVMNEKSETVDMTFKDKNGNLLCTVNDVVPGGEATCNVLDEGVAEKLTTDTYIDIDGCSAKVHTSCSSDIVGMADDCGILVTGWADGNPNDNNDCDDGLVECSCEDGVFVDPPEIPEEVDVVVTSDYCYCSTTDPLATPSPTTYSSKKSKSKSKSKETQSLGVGECDCKDGVNEIRYVNIDSSESATITVFYDGLDSDIVCQDSDVEPGQETTCNIYNSGIGETRFEKDTFVRMEFDSGETCEGSWHTSCSKDIVGWTADGCTNIIVSGWGDNSGTDDCDDGFEPCECETAYDCSSYGEGCHLNQDAFDNGACCYDANINCLPFGDAECDTYSDAAGSNNNAMHIGSYSNNANMINSMKVIVSIILFALFL